VFVALFSGLDFSLESTLDNFLPHMLNAADEESLELAFFDIADGIPVFLLLNAFFAFLQFTLEFSNFVGVIGLQDLDVVSRLLFHFFKAQFGVENDV
jgi:hypothetical protein